MSELQVVQPQGRLDALGARSLWTELEPLTREEHVHILVDMTETRYISSDGLRVLMRASKNTKNNGGKLVLCCLTARIEEIISMAGLDHILEIHPTRTAAERALVEHDAPKP
jgi:anti-sigma B factor antagonist